MTSCTCAAGGEEGEGRGCGNKRAAVAAAMRLSRFIIHAIPVHKKDIWSWHGKTQRERVGERDRTFSNWIPNKLIDPRGGEVAEGGGGCTYACAGLSLGAGCAKHRAGYECGHGHGHGQCAHFARIAPGCLGNMNLYLLICDSSNSNSNCCRRIWIW